MNEEQIQKMENRIREAAGHFRYPATPDIAVSVRLTEISQPRTNPLPRLQSRLVLIAGLMIITITALMAVPPVRAQVLDFIQIGAVRIFLISPTPTGTPTVTSTPLASTAEATSTSQLPTQTPFPARLASLSDLSGETTLEKAQEMVDFQIPLPDQTTSLGKPDRVYVMNMTRPMVILVWVDAQDPEKARLSLHLISPGSYALEKLPPVKIKETEVNGAPAIWATGPYIVKLKSRELDFTRLIEGHVLIWKEGEITYRLETDLSIAEAVAIAESLH